MTRFIALTWLSLSCAWGLAAPSDALRIAADYYFNRQDYPQALQLWSEVYRRQPESALGAQRVAELSLLLEGRAFGRDVLVQYLNQNERTLSADTVREMKQTLDRLLAVFLTDEGQSLFLQAAPLLREKDCSPAFPLLQHAATLEKGNVRIAREKACCEKSMGLWAQYPETIKEWVASDPFDGDAVVALAEAHFYFREFAKVLTLLRGRPDGQRTARERTVYAAALAEVGETEKALPLLVKQETTSPAVLFALGRILAAQPENTAAARDYLSRFLLAAKKAPAAAWDPYRMGERVEMAQRLLVSLAPSKTE